MKPAFIPALCLFFLLSFSIAANHNMGGELTYKYLNGESWLVTLKAYRDCNGGAYSMPYLKVTSACGTDSFAMTQKSVTDITPAMGYCPGQTHCADTLYKYGVEEILFERTITLNDTCCSYTLSWTDCCRNMGLSGPTTWTLYVEAKLNRCMHNSSPVFDVKPRILFPVNQATTISFHATDPEGDTLTYEQVNPLLNATTAYTYSGSFSAIKPVSFSGFPNNTLVYPSGIRFDSTGNLMFTPIVQNQSSHMAVKITQWKTINGALTNIGEITRDIQYIVTPNNGNNSPEFIGYENTLEYCKTAAICKTIKVIDRDTTDTVTVSVLHNITGLTWSVSGSLSSPVVEICYTPDSTAVAKGADQFFRIIANDGKCNTPGYSERNFILRMLPELPDSFGIEKVQLCSDVTLSLQNSSSITTGLSTPWLVTSPSGKIINVTTFALSRNLADTGWHKILLNVRKSGYCISRYYTDSVYISPNNNISVKALPDTLVCFNPAVTVRSSVTSGTPPFTYLWTGGDTTPAKSITVPPGVSYYKIEVQDSFKCKAVDSARVSFFNPQVTLTGDTLICKGKPATITANATNAIKPKFAWSGFTNTNSQLVDAPDTSRQYQVTLTDSAGCKVTKQWNVSVYSPTLSFPAVTPVCAGDSVVLKTTAANGKAPYVILWLPIGPTGDSVKVKTDSVATTTNKKFPVMVTDARGCSATDSATVQVKPLPNVYIIPFQAACNQAGIINLSSHGMPLGGFWIGKGVSIDKLNTAVSDTGIIDLRYIYASTNGCQNYATSTIYIQMAPVARFTVDSLKGPVTHTFSFTNTSVMYPSSPTTWNFDDPPSGSANNSSLLNPQHQFTDSGSYKVKLTVSGGVCAADTEVKVIKVYRKNNVGIKETPAAKAQVYPNPASDFITVEGSELKNIRLLDLQGRYVSAAFIQTADNQYSLSVRTLTAGVYFVEITDDYNNISQVKITVHN